MKNIKKNVPLLYVVGFIGLIKLLELASFTVPPFIRDTITLTLGVVYEAFPFVLLGVLLSTVVQLYINDAALLKILPRRAVTRRAALSMSGSFLPVCECGNVPLARGLMMKGLSPQDALTFLLAAPIINPVTAITTHQAFGAHPLLLPLRITGAFFISNIVGWLFEGKRKKSMISDPFEHYCQKFDQHENEIRSKKHHAWQQHLLRFAETFYREIRTLLPALIFGSLLAGVVQTTIPREWLLSVAEQPVLAILTMMLLAFIVSICANVDAFFALSLSGIFPMSAILAFLLFGPMIDMKMIALLKTTYTTRTIATTTFIVVLCTLACSLGAHYVI